VRWGDVRSAWSSSVLDMCRYVSLERLRGALVLGSNDFLREVFDLTVERRAVDIYLEPDLRYYPQGEPQTSRHRSSQPKNRRS
jgi:hypothetical protein